MLYIFAVLSVLVFSFSACRAPIDREMESQTPVTLESGQIAKVGLGHMTSIEKSKDLKVLDDEEVLPLGQVDTVIVAAAFDKDGKVVKVSIDNAQTKVNFDKELQLTSDLTVTPQTKVELGDDYGMIRASTIDKEWYEQIAELENWMIGKTVAEVKAMNVKERDATHIAVPDVPELTSSVTITVEDYIAGLEKAYENAFDVSAGAETLGLGHVVSIAKSKGYSNEDDEEILPLAQVDTVIVVSAFDLDGKVVRSIIDTAQTKVNFDQEGKVTSDRTAEIKSKVELGADYGMARVSSIGKEWDEQIAALEKWMEGKTVAEVKAMKFKEPATGGKSVSDEPELISSVTIDVAVYLEGLEESYENAK
jgi:hypothetical protein